MILSNIQENTCGIYCLLNKSNGKRYIGLSRNILKRIKDHQKALQNNNHYNGYLQAAYEKGEFIVFLIQECLPEDLKKYEMFWIQEYKTYDRANGYNLTKGGEDLGNLTEEAKERKRLNRTGKSSSLKGKKQSKEWIKARMDKLRGRKRNYSPEHIQSIKDAMEKRQGTRQKGKIVIVTNIDSGEILNFKSKREVEDFLGIPRDTLIHKFYQGRPRKILKKISYSHYIIER